MKFSTVINRCRDAHRYQSFQDINSKKEDIRKKKNQPKVRNTTTTTGITETRNHQRIRNRPEAGSCTSNHLSQNLDQVVVTMRQHHHPSLHSQNGIIEWDNSKTYYETNKLREENLKLKQRLHAAKNTIRDLEYAGNNRKDDSNTNIKDQDIAPTTSTKLFCSFLLPKKPPTHAQTSKMEHVSSQHRMDDQSVFSSSGFSQASTVKTGSVSRSKSKKNRNVTRNSSTLKQMKSCKRSDGNLVQNQQNNSCFHSFTSCPSSLKKKNHNAWVTPSSSSSIEFDNFETETEPCSPDRSPSRPRGSYRSNKPYSSSRNNVSSMRSSSIAQDKNDNENNVNSSISSRMNIMDDPNFDNIGIRTYQSTTLIPVQQKLEKMNFLAQAAMKTIPLSFLDMERHTNNSNKHDGNVECIFERSEYGGGSKGQTFQKEGGYVESRDRIIGHKNFISEVDTSSDSSTERTDITDEDYRFEI